MGDALSPSGSSNAKGKERFSKHKPATPTRAASANSGAASSEATQGSTATPAEVSVLAPAANDTATSATNGGDQHLAPVVARAETLPHQQAPGNAVERRPSDEAVASNGAAPGTGPADGTPV